MQEQIERYFEFSLFAMIVTGFVSLAGTGRLDPVSLIFGLSALGLRAFFLLKNRRVVLSVQVTSQLTVAYVVFYFLDFFFFSANFVVATVHLVLFIMVVKLFSVQSERDHLYLAVISFLMILASAVLTVDSFFLATFSLFLLLTVTTSISMEMRRSLAEAVKNDEKNPTKAIAAGQQDSKKRLSRSISFAGAVLVISIVTGAAMIFFVLPRISGGYLNKLASRSGFSTGFSDEVTLGDIGRIQQLDTVVMHVQFAQGTHLPPNLKWRGMSLNSFDGKRWHHEPPFYFPLSSEADGRLDVQRLWSKLIAGPPVLRAGERYQTLNYRVSMQPIGTNVFFVLPILNSVSSPIRYFGLDSAGNLIRTDPMRQIRSFTAISTISEPSEQDRTSQSREYPPTIEKDNLQLLNLDPRIAKLAGDVTKDSKSIYQKTAAIEKFLQSQFGYTLDMVAPPANTDPISFFLFSRKKGHCEYFSSAMVVMLRTQGIPSRIVNGFRNGEYNDVSGSYIVRARDAHSWVEAYIPGFGWATFDPTPASVVGESSPWSRMMLYADAMREFWNDWIVNYDFAHQESLGTSTISRTRQAFDSVRIWIQKKYQDALERVRGLRFDVKRNPKKIGGTGLLLLVAVLLLLNARRIYFYLRNMRIARKPATAPRAAASIWYERMSKMLSRRGLERKPSQTPQDFLQTIEDSLIHTKVASFTEHYERARFGDSQEDAGKLPDLYEEVETAAKR
jgi:transglutaminase-like putative cysteine protease